MDWQNERVGYRIGTPYLPSVWGEGCTVMSGKFGAIARTKTSPGSVSLRYNETDVNRKLCWKK